MIGGVLSGISQNTAIGVTLATGVKTSAPSVSAVDTTSENTTITITIPGFNASNVYFPSVNAGVLDTSVHPYTWKLPFVTATSEYVFEVYVKALGELQSDVTQHTVTVTEGIVSVDSSITYTSAEFTTINY